MNPPRLPLAALSLAATLAACAGNSASPPVTGSASTALRPAAGIAHSATTSKSQPTLTTLYTFAGAPDCTQPESGLAISKSGQIFGTTITGGVSNNGCVFELTPQSGSYKESVAHSFSTAVDGDYPVDKPALDSKGNLYVTASGFGGKGYGTIVELSPNGGTYDETGEIDFPGTNDFVFAGPALRGKTIYIATALAGNNGHGTITSIALPNFAATDVYDFAGTPSDGSDARSSLVADKSGALYGTTLAGGLYNQGTVFRFTPSGGGTLTILHSFEGGANGANPTAGVALDKAGNVYGFTPNAGTDNDGIIYKLTKATGYSESVLHTFSGQPDGQVPLGAPIFKGSTLYGTTNGGGSANYGTIFQIGESGSNYAVDYNFTGATDGANPDGALLLHKGALYGTASHGGSGNGTVFRFGK